MSAKNPLPPPPLEAVAAAFPQLEIIELIGQGGMGVVYKARQPKLDRYVALKVLTPSAAADPAFAERFNREARLLARLNHPHIVAVYDFGQSGQFYYLLMEYVDGVNLRQAMRAGRFTPAQALALVPKICEALQYAHDEGILHRDIKPENLLLDLRGRIKIADFGIAKLMNETAQDLNLTASGAAVGTPHYMAPEQLEHPQDVDQRADIYSLGVVFYEMLTGELPIGRFAPPSEKTSVDSRVDHVVFRALEKEREKRYRSAGEVKTSVEAITEKPIAAQEPAGARQPALICWGVALLIGLPIVLLIITFLVWPIIRHASPVKSSATIPTSTKAQPGKTLVFTRATNQLIDTATEVRTVTVWTDSTVLPGETLQAMQRLPDGQFTTANGSLHVQRSPKGTKTSSAFTWFFRDSFGDQEAQSAVAQLQLNVLERPVALLAGQPLALFSVTNKVGGVLSGSLVYKIFTPVPPIGSTASATKAHATVRLRPSGTLAFYSAEVPPGYALQATANWSEIDDGDASTMSPSGPNGYHSSWRLPSFRFSSEAQKEVGAQLARLAEQGPVQVVFGEPRRLFSVTNKTGEVFHGLLELVGPPAATNP